MKLQNIFLDLKKIYLIALLNEKSVKFTQVCE